MRVYISEEEFFNDFSNPDYLFWENENVEYGDWTSGPNGDGSLTYTDVIKATDVSALISFLGTRKDNKL